MKNFILLTAICAALASAQWLRAASESEIYQAVRSGERARVAELLQNGVSPNQRDANGNTLLMRAAVYGEPELLKFLLDKGADVNATNAQGATALMRAARDAAKVKVLIAHGAEVNASSAMGNTPLILAARAYPSAEAVRLLLDRGANVSATNVFGANAIMTAAASGDLDTVRLLLKHGADVNAHSRGRDDAVIWGGGRSPLMWAAARGDLPMMKLLLEAGANVNEPEGFGNALIQAAWTDKLEAARLLVEHGADVNARDFRNGYTALHWAASSEMDSRDFVQFLLKKGANLNAEGGLEVDAFLGIGQTPLMLAQKRGDTAVTQMLTDLHGKVNATTEKPRARGHREVAAIDEETLRRAMNQAVAPIQKSAVESKQNFLSHGSKQQCVSCHQQYMPMAATAYARRSGATLDAAAAAALTAMVKGDNGGLEERTIEATFHPEPAHSYGYALFALGAQGEAANPQIDAIVQHLLVIQDKNGEWHNNLPRPPIQTSDVAPTALAIKALKTYGFPGRQTEIEERIARARGWLRQVRAANTEELTYQILGLVWAGESAEQVASLSAELKKQQQPDGGWAQLPTLETDAYATGQALFTLHTAGTKSNAPVYRNGLAYLLRTQLDDGTWHVVRRAFPFQPTMRSGFPHSRDSWISCTATSWATMAMALAIEDSQALHASAK